MKKSILLLLTILICQIAVGQTYQEIKLYQNIPGEIKLLPEICEVIESNNGMQWVKNVTIPELHYYPPQGVNTGAAVIICPGGGYAGLAITKEGYDVAERLSEFGVSAFVLKYRLPDNRIMQDKKIAPLQDVQQAIKTIRENADKFNVNPNNIGVMGFSAGGHLAASAATHFNDITIENVNNTSLRPDFSILIYPVITFGEDTHQGSRNNLIGTNADQSVIDYFSNEKMVTADTPISFMIHANDDKVVSVDNTLNYVRALNKAGVKNEAHIYSTGGHGFGLNNNSIKDCWMERLRNWMLSEGILD